MKYTRKEILQKALPASAALLLAGSPLLSFVLKDTKSNEITFLEALNSDLYGIPDIILLDDSSIDEFNFLAIFYNRETMDYPAVLFSKNRSNKPKNQNMFRDNLSDLRTYATNKDICILDNKPLLKAIVKNDFEITPDLYRAVSFCYLSAYDHFEKCVPCPEKWARSAEYIIKREKFYKKIRKLIAKNNLKMQEEGKV